MRPIAIVLAIAALAAVLTGVLAKLWLERQVAVKSDQAVPAHAEILVAARDIPAGTVLSASDLRYDPWPEGLVTPRLMVRRGADDPRAKVVGQVTRRNLAEGEPFSPAATFRADSAGILAGMLAPGMRAVSIAITNPSAVSGMVMPGDRVDVVLATDVSKAMDQAERKAAGGEILRYAAETVLDDVKVLAIDQHIARTRDVAIQGKTATLEVSPKQAEILTAAGMVGSLQLVLRGLPAAGPAVAVPAAEPGFTPDTEVSRALHSLGEVREAPAKVGGGSIQINRAGHISSEGNAR